MARRKSKGWSKLPSVTYKKEAEEALTRKVRVLGFTAFEGVIQKSPVLTGRYRGNHKLSIGTPDYSYDESTTIQTPNIPKQPYMTIYISNSLPYAEVIEYGNENREPQNVYANTFRDIQNP